MQILDGQLVLSATDLVAYFACEHLSGALSQNQVQRLLGLASRWEVDAILKRAGVYLEYTEEDLNRELEASHELTDR